MEQNQEMLYSAWRKLIAKNLRMKTVTNAQIDYLRKRWLAVFEGIVGISDTAFPLFFGQIRDELESMAK